MLEHRDSLKVRRRIPETKLIRHRTMLCSLGWIVRRFEESAGYRTLEGLKRSYMNLMLVPNDNVKLAKTYVSFLL